MLNHTRMSRKSKMIFATTGNTDSSRNIGAVSVQLNWVMQLTSNEEKKATIDKISATEPTIKRLLNASGKRWEQFRNNSVGFRNHLFTVTFGYCHWLTGWISAHYCIDSEEEEEEEEGSSELRPYCDRGLKRKTCTHFRRHFRTLFHHLRMDVLWPEAKAHWSRLS